MSGVVRRVATGGTELAVEVRGAGRPIVFIPGFPFDRTMWRHQIATLPRWKRAAVDLPGSGDSGPPTDPCDVPTYAAAVVAVIDALGAGPAVVCGLSLGGYILMELLRQAADRVRAAVFCCTRAVADTDEERAARDRTVLAAEHDGVAAVVESLMPRVLAPATIAAQPELVRQVREMGARWSVAGVRAAQKAMRDRLDATDTLRGVRVPALVLAGAEDVIAPATEMEAMAALMPRAHFTAIPAAGHLAPLEQPLATSRRLVDFVDALS